MQLLAHRSACRGHGAYQISLKRKQVEIRSSHAPPKAWPGGTPAASGTDAIGHILQQHRLLMEAGFSYDQASLILRVSGQQANPRSTALPAADTALLEQQAAPAVPSTSSGASAAIDRDAQQRQQQQQQPSMQEQQLAALQDRISFLEMELLKQSLMIDAVHASSNNITDHATASGSGTLQNGQLAGVASSGRLPNAQQHGLPVATLDPNVAAIAEALAIRQALLSPAAAAALAAADALAGNSTVNQQQQQQQQQQQRRQPSGIWGRRRVQQLQAKPWRYREAVPTRGTEVAGSIRDYDVDCTDELVPYEAESPAAVVGTMLVVYIGVLFAFVAILAGGSGGGDVLPADILFDISP